jgi:hypothetical protein
VHLDKENKFLKNFWKDKGKEFKFVDEMGFYFEHPKTNVSSNYVSPNKIN